MQSDLHANSYIICIFLIEITKYFFLFAFSFAHKQRLKLFLYVSYKVISYIKQMHFEWNGIINFYCGFNCNWCQISMKSHKLVYTKTNAVDLLVGWFNFTLIQWQNYADLQSIGWYSKYCINAILNVSFVLRLKFSPKLLIFFVIAAITVKILHFECTR